MPKFRQRSILSIRWHWPTLTAFGPFWTVARHRMAIVPGDQIALWAPASPSLPLLPFTAIRSPFGASVRPSEPFSPLTGEEWRCCGQRPHRCRGIWRPPGRAYPVPGRSTRRPGPGCRMRPAPGPGGQYGQGISISLYRSPATQFCYLAEQLQSWARDVQVDPRRRVAPGKRRWSRYRLPVGSARCSYGDSQASTALGWLCPLSSRPGVRVPPGALVVSVRRGDRDPTVRSRYSWFLAG